MHAIQVINPFDVRQLIGITTYFVIRKTALEEYEDQNILKRELTTEDPPGIHQALSLAGKRRL